MLKPYAWVDCPSSVQFTISSKVLDYLKHNTDLLNDKNHQLWNKINTLSLLKAVPEINKFYRSIGLKIMEISITVCNSYDDVALHIDEGPVTAKINFPILNTKNTINEWYTVPQGIMNTVKPKINVFGAKYYNLESVDLEKCVLLDAIELSQPVIFNSQIPHKIRIAEQAQLPRIVMPCMFFDEPISFLES